MAARKTTKPKSEKSAPRTRKKAEPAPEVQESAGLSRAAWGAIWAGLGVLTLLALLPIDGALLRWLHRFIGGFIGRGGLLLPFALFALSALLFLRPKGPVRLRGACIGLLPVLFGGIVHAITCANEYDFSMKTIRNLLETGMESHSGGLFSGMLYIVLEWALSSAGALIVLLLLTFAAIMVACRITPMMLIDMFRPPEYEYEEKRSAHAMKSRCSCRTCTRSRARSTLRTRRSARSAAHAARPLTLTSRSTAIRPARISPAARYRLSIRLMRRASRSRRMNICGD